MRDKAHAALHGQLLAHRRQGSRPTAISAPTPGSTPYDTPFDEYGNLVKAFNFDPEDTSTSGDGHQVNPLYNATLSSFRDHARPDPAQHCGRQMVRHEGLLHHRTVQRRYQDEPVRPLHLARGRDIPRRNRSGQTGRVPARHGQGLQLRRQDRLNYGRNLDDRGTASWSMPAPTSSTPIRPRRTPRR